MNNSNTIQFFMAMEPPTVTAQEHKVAVRNGRPMFYDPPELKAARQKLTDALIPRKPPDRLQGPLELIVAWCFPTKDDWKDGMPMTSKPDTDNLNKLLKDCMTRVGFWEDDAQVCREIIEKFWVKTTPCGIWVSVCPLRSRSDL